MATSVQIAYTSNTNALVATNLGALGTPSDLRRFLCVELRSAGVSTTLNALQSYFTNRNCKGKHWPSAFKVVWQRSDVHFTDVTNVDWKTTRLSRACLLSNVGGAQLLGITNVYQKNAGTSYGQLMVARWSCIVGNTLSSLGG
jgi:hypothetical protein